MSALHVIFKVQGGEFVIPAAQVVQMESYRGATAVPGSPPYVAGIVQVRGKVVPVVDLRRRFGQAATEVTFDSRIVVGQTGERAVALLVDSAREVVKLSDAELEPPPRMVAEETNGFVKAVARQNGRLLMLIDFNKVIGEDHVG